MGRAVILSLMVGSGCEGGGVPRRSRALAFTALVGEKTSFFALDLGIGADLLRVKYSVLLMDVVVTDSGTKK